jgi:hypothetical protein
MCLHAYINRYINMYMYMNIYTYTILPRIYLVPYWLKGPNFYIRYPMYMYKVNIYVQTYVCIHINIDVNIHILK